MRKRFGKRTRLLGAAMLVSIAAFAAWGFTASNTVPGSNAGAGSGTISGYTVSNISYTLNGTTPTNIDSVAFTIAPTAATTVRVQLVTGGSWYSCTNAAGSVTCGTTSPQATVAPANNLTVVAVQ